MWKRSEFQSLKDKITIQLQNKFSEANAGDERLAFLLEQVSYWKAQNASQAGMKTYLYCMFALSTHLQFGGLKDSQVRDLLYLAESMLTLGNVKPKTSVLAYLYGELHLVTSQLHTLAGEAFLASWEQQIAVHLSGSQAPGGWDYQTLHSGIQALRLGFSELARDDFSKVWRQSENSLLRAKAGIHLIRCLRLSGKVDEAENFEPELSCMSLSEKARLEISWEKACRHMQLGGDPSEIFQLIKRNGPHYKASYILESFFWARAVASLEWINRLPKLKTLRQKKEFNFQHYTVFFRCAQELEKAYDTEIPLQHRLQHAKRILSSLTGLQDIDKHLLTLAALLRWLIRSNYRRLARLLYAEYCAMNQRLSSGTQTDVLGLFKDREQKSWLSGSALD